jgi:hypothetical protein
LPELWCRQLSVYAEQSVQQRALWKWLESDCIVLTSRGQAGPVCANGDSPYPAGMPLAIVLVSRCGQPNRSLCADAPVYPKHPETAPGVEGRNEGCSQGQGFGKPRLARSLHRCSDRLDVADLESPSRCVLAQSAQANRSPVQPMQAAPVFAQPPIGVVAITPLASHANLILLATQALKALSCDKHFG